MIYTLGYLSVFALCGFGVAICVLSGNQNTINNLFQSGGAGTVVQICSGTTISVTDTITFTADNQEISTYGYPTDSSRAIIQPASGSNVSMFLNGYGYDGRRVKNIQFDGRRPSLGFVQAGQQSNGIEISNIVSKNARVWSCLHLIQGGSDNPCTKVTIDNNQIGPCGNEGTNSAGAGLWADGISFACQDSLIENDQITGSTDGGIVLFGAPGITVQGNTIISSSTDSGFGAINMVDYLYDCSYVNIVVTNNTIIR